MQSQNRFFDDIARVASGALGTLSGMRSEFESRLREQLERVLAGMDLVTREEFEAVKAMAAKARTEQEALLARVAELERRLAEAAAPEDPKVRRATPST
ncbi:MAG TPA: accessory factor UbiK family protein [Stellaceae bacterium]|nr:accessory factor UbiK family protein [Stellaceae bacterium]